MVSMTSDSNKKSSRLWKRCLLLAKFYFTKQVLHVANVSGVFFQILDFWGFSVLNGIFLTLYVLGVYWNHRFFVSYFVGILKPYRECPQTAIWKRRLCTCWYPIPPLKATKLATKTIISPPSYLILTLSLQGIQNKPMKSAVLIA